MFYLEHPKILGTRMKASVAMATWRPVFVCFYIFQFFISCPSGRITVLGRTLPTEKKMTSMSWGWRGKGVNFPVRSADRFATFIGYCLEILEVSTLRALRAFPGLYRDYFIVTYINHFKVFRLPIQPLQFDHLLS